MWILLKCVSLVLYFFVRRKSPSWKLYCVILNMSFVPTNWVANERPLKTPLKFRAFTNNSLISHQINEKRYTGEFKRENFQPPCCFCKLNRTPPAHLSIYSIPQKILYTTVYCMAVRFHFFPVCLPEKKRQQ